MVVKSGVLLIFVFDFGKVQELVFWDYLDGEDILVFFVRL